MCKQRKDHKDHRRKFTVIFHGLGNGGHSERAARCIDSAAWGTHCSASGEGAGFERSFAPEASPRRRIGRNGNCKCSETLPILSGREWNRSRRHCRCVLGADASPKASLEISTLPIQNSLRSHNRTYHSKLLWFRKYIFIWRNVVLLVIIRTSWDLNLKQSPSLLKPFS